MSPGMILPGAKWEIQSWHDPSGEKIPERNLARIRLGKMSRENFPSPIVAGSVSGIWFREKILSPIWAGSVSGNFPESNRGRIRLRNLIPGKNPKSNLGRIRLRKISKVQSDLRSVPNRMLSNHIVWGPIWRQILLRKISKVQSDLRSVPNRMLSSRIFWGPIRPQIRPEKVALQPWFRDGPVWKPPLSTCIWYLLESGLAPDRSSTWMNSVAYFKDRSDPGSVTNAILGKHSLQENLQKQSQFQAKSQFGDQSDLRSVPKVSNQSHPGWGPIRCQARFQKMPCPSWKAVVSKWSWGQTGPQTTRL